MKRGGKGKRPDRKPEVQTDHRVNRQIRAREVQLIDDQGENRGITPIQEALQMAEEAGLDLVEVAKNAKPPVCKIMDFGKLVYQSKKKKTVSKSATSLKEISFSMKIGPHDIETKMKKAKQFLEKGHKLRINLILRGRERAYADTNGKEQLQRLCAMLEGDAIVEQMSRGMVGNRMSAILSPTKN
ncbi:translation initiation factor IF-3 [bacterium]|nr:translation initiation factor IF-3 [bacterium]